MMKKLEIKVIPKASEDEVVGFEGGVLKVKCRAIPEKGKANKAVIAILAKHFHIPKKALSIIKGETSGRKIIAIEAEYEDHIFGDKGRDQTQN